MVYMEIDDWEIPLNLNSNALTPYPAFYALKTMSYYIK